MSVLKQDECTWVDDLRETENVTLFSGWRTGLLSTIDRLVAEVARLRARNEALEKVVKWANEMNSGVRNDNYRRAHEAEPRLSAALSSLNPSDPNSSGGET